MNSFLADGGDGFSVFTQCTNPLGGEVDLDAVVRYFQQNSPIAPPSLNRDHAPSVGDSRWGRLRPPPPSLSVASRRGDLALRDGVRAGLPLALAPLLFGASFGVLASTRVSARPVRS